MGIYIYMELVYFLFVKIATIIHSILPLDHRCKITVDPGEEIDVNNYKLSNVNLIIIFALWDKKET